MNRSAPRPIIEILVETGAALSLGGACAFAVAQVGPWAAALVAGLVGAGAAACISARVDRPQAAPGGHFDLIDFLFDEDDASILLLDDPILVDDDALLLDDPLPRAQDDGRVVRLFTAVRPVPAEQATIADPSEMVTRIEEFLAKPRAAGASINSGPVNAASDDASAALHAALADIRRSLRQA